MLHFYILLQITLFNRYIITILTLYKVKSPRQYRRVAKMEKIGGNY